LAAGTDVLSKIAGNEMTYRISYDEGLFTVGPAGVTRTEYYRTEFEAMKRARQLLEEGITTASPCMMVWARF
jgi:hypothetical protein